MCPGKARSVCCSPCENSSLPLRTVPGARIHPSWNWPRCLKWQKSPAAEPLPSFFRQMPACCVTPPRNSYLGQCLSHSLRNPVPLLRWRFEVLGVKSRSPTPPRHCPSFLTLRTDYPTTCVTICLPEPIPQVPEGTQNENTGKGGPKPDPLSTGGPSLLPAILAVPILPRHQGVAISHGSTLL